MLGYSRSPASFSFFSQDDRGLSEYLTLRSPLGEEEVSLQVSSPSGLAWLGPFLETPESWSLQSNYRCCSPGPSQDTHSWGKVSVTRILSSHTGQAHFCLPPLPLSTHVPFPISPLQLHLCPQPAWPPALFPHRCLCNIGRVPGANIAWQRFPDFVAQ